MTELIIWGILFLFVLVNTSIIVLLSLKQRKKNKPLLSLIQNITLQNKWSDVDTLLEDSIKNSTHIEFSLW